MLSITVECSASTDQLFGCLHSVRRHRAHILASLLAFMNTNLEDVEYGRRAFWALLVSGLGIFAWFRSRRTKVPENPMAKVAPLVKPLDKWSADDFYSFLKELPASTMLTLKKSLEIAPASPDDNQAHKPDEDAREIQKQALWLSSNILTYPFRDEKKLNYHELTTWVCTEAGVSQEVIKSKSTFKLELELHKLLFAQMWEKLDQHQREELLARIDPNGAIKDKAAIAALSGAGALAALSATVAFTGFAFYTTMSITIATVASAVGVTLPFAAYTGASTAVGVLSGPVGWAILGVAALGGVALAGRPNLQKTTALIGQIHALKVEALIAANIPFPE